MNVHGLPLLRTWPIFTKFSRRSSSQNTDWKNTRAPTYYPEHGDNTSLWNFCKFVSDYVALHPRTLSSTLEKLFARNGKRPPSIICVLLPADRHDQNDTRVKNISWFTETGFNDPTQQTGCGSILKRHVRWLCIYHNFSAVFCVHHKLTSFGNRSHRGQEYMQFNIMSYLTGDGSQW